MDEIPERCWAEARDIVFQKYHAIQMLNDDKLDRAFNWPPDALVSETAARLAAKLRIRELEQEIKALKETNG